MVAALPVPAHKMSKPLQHTMSPSKLPQPASPSSPKIQPPFIGHSPASKRAAFIASHSMSEDLSENIANDAEFLEHVGWAVIVHLKCTGSVFSSLENVNHPGKCILNDLKLHVTPVRFDTQEWS